MGFVSLYRYLIICFMAMIVTACMSAGKIEEQKNKMVWPDAPAQPRVMYEFAFARAEDLGIEKGFWKMLGEFFAGPENIHMVRPMAVVNDENGVIYVADPGAKGIHRYHRAEQKYDLIRLRNNVELPSPVALTSDDMGNVFFSDSQLAKIFWIRAEADYAVELELDTKLKQPTGLALDSTGQLLYVVDTAQHQVLVFNRGRLIRRIGKRGTANGEFNFPTMIWRDQQDNLLVTDSLNFRIQKFDVDGHYKTQFGKVGDASGSHARPKGLAVDSVGHVYVVDSLFHNVQIFNSSGQFLLDVGEQGREQGQFWLPTGIFIDQQKKIYVADSHNQRVQVFSYIGVDE